MNPVVPLLLMVGLALSGCVSYKARVAPGADGVRYERFFVQRNLNDNHAIDRHILSALAAHGFEAESGPLTMLPENTQVILSYTDRWGWDFGEHLIVLDVVMKDARTGRQLGVASLNRRFGYARNAPEVVRRLVDELLAAAAPDAG